MYMHEHDLHVPLCLSTGVFYRSVEPFTSFYLLSEMVPTAVFPRLSRRFLVWSVV